MYRCVIFCSGGLFSRAAEKQRPFVVYDAEAFLVRSEMPGASLDEPPQSSVRVTVVLARIAIIQVNHRDLQEATQIHICSRQGMNRQGME